MGFPVAGTAKDQFRGSNRFNKMKQVGSAVVQNGGKTLSIGIIGAGLAGLTCAIMLRKQGYLVTVIEKKQFPFHRVCGEYVSNEILPFLSSLNLDINCLNPSRISRLLLSSPVGKSMEASLEMGGFGISRYVFDNYLYQEALACGIKFIFAKANNILFENNEFSIDLSIGTTVTCQLAIAAYGKRANLDQKLNRSFFYQRSPYIGVKYHIKTDLPKDLVRLDSFTGGYCGTCKIEDDLFNLCYLSETKNLKAHASISEMERKVLFKNPHIRQIFENSDFVFEKPEVINEISFERKSLVEDHVLFCGDAAGMITPLCGNGMAMAIHSGKILAECIIQNGNEIRLSNRLRLESDYKEKWKKHFLLRLNTGRFIQRLFLNPRLSHSAIAVLKRSKFLSNMLMKSTHGKSF